MSPDEVKIWCNNREAVVNSSLINLSRRDVAKADADLVLAIMQEKKNFKSVSVLHVYAHQDTKKGKQKLKKAEDKQESEKAKKHREKDYSGEEEILKMFSNPQ